jgi:hypothetical protein
MFNYRSYSTNINITNMDDYEFVSFALMYVEDGMSDKALIVRAIDKEPNFYNKMHELWRYEK